MTVAALVSQASYIEDGVTTSFPAPFRYQDPSNLVVDRIAVDGTITTLPYGSGFTATAGPTDAGGAVSPVVISTGTRLRIRRRTPRAQQAEYATGDRFPAKLTEGGLDVAMLIDQEQDDFTTDLSNRALLYPDGEMGYVLPVAAARANTIQLFDAAGRPLLAPYSADAGAALAALVSGLIPFTLFDDAVGAFVTGYLRLSGGVITIVPA